MSTETNNETKILTRLAAMVIGETITVTKDDMNGVSLPRLRVYISRYATQYGKSFKTQCALNGDLHILRQAISESK